ncbi:MAG: NADPH:quinone oxidoreductase family protein, partial [Burkholderiales bacterium]
MKAVLCKQYGPPESLTFEELPSPRPGPGEAVVSVKAASVNFPDVLIIQNKYQFKPPLPFSPGSELSGVVKEVGEGVAGFKPGDKVIAFTTYGAFAEEVKTEAARLVPMPQGMDYASAAAFLLTYATSDHALRDRGALQAGETLLVLGAAGGVGLAAVEIGKALGARVIACASSGEKLEVCRGHGADATINYASEDLRERIKALTDGR